MPEVDLTELWIHRADDPTQYVTFDGGQAAGGVAKPGQPRVMANGRVRTVTAAGATEVLAYEVPNTPRATWQTLDDWVRAGVLFMLRDAVGRVRWGSIFELGGPDLGDHGVSLSFQFQVITYDESV